MPKRKRPTVIDVPSNSPLVEQFETDAIILRFGAPMLGSFVFLPQMLCAECQLSGVFVISVHCTSCGHRINRIACARSNMHTTHGQVTVDRDVLMCEDCIKRDGDTAPPIAGGPLGVFDSRRLN